MSARSRLVRWCKFNLVGALGMAIQLSTLALLNSAWKRHYLLTSAAAVELAVIHNFVWHIHFTWKDRRGDTRWPVQLLRFHLSNGLASLAGNLLLMRLFVHQLHLPVLPANAITVACCSVVNFTLSDRWTFQRRSRSRANPCSVAQVS